VKAQIRKLQESVLENTENIRETRVLTEHSLTTWTFREYTLANAPLAAQGMLGFAMAIISDGHKDGEGPSPAIGTGVVAMYDPTQDDWLRTSDYTVVTTA